MIGTNNGSAAAPNGRLEMHRIGELEVLEHIQRVPRESRVKTLAREGWQAKKQGILLVAKIVGGEHADTLHVYDGGTRLRVARITVGSDYEIPCWVEDMTEAEAAEKFDIFNSESKKPTPFDHYKVGIAYGEPHQLAIKASLDSLGLVGGETASYGNGEPGSVAALAACKRVIKGVYKTTKDRPEAERWEVASGRLADVLSIMREAYLDDTAHDADMIQAVARLRAQHGEFSDAVRRHLVNVIQTATAAQWRSMAQHVQDASGGQGGSVSRANTIAGLIATDHNKTASAEAKLDTALSRV